MASAGGCSLDDDDDDDGDADVLMSVCIFLYVGITSVLSSLSCVTRPPGYTLALSCAFNCMACLYWGSAYHSHILGPTIHMSAR